MGKLTRSLFQGVINVFKQSNLLTKDSFFQQLLNFVGANKLINSVIVAEELQKKNPSADSPFGQLRLRFLIRLNENYVNFKEFAFRDKVA